MSAMKKLVWLAVAAAGFVLLLQAQQEVFRGEVEKVGNRIPTIAIPELKGSGEAQAFMSVFNQTLLSDVTGSGVVKVAPKTLYPLTVPQQPSDFTQPPQPSDNPRGRKSTVPPPTSGGGRWMIDWAGPPVNAN